MRRRRSFRGRSRSPFRGQRIRLRRGRRYGGRRRGRSRSRGVRALRIGYRM